MNNKLLVLTGPTAVGKTALSIKLAQMTGGEIVSADSMQVYRHMDIGTAKIRKEEMQGVPHHLIDVLEPTEPFNVKLFQEMASRAVADIHARGRLPVITGGTGFYIRALLYQTDFTLTDDDTAIRSAYERLIAEGGDAARDALHEKLCGIDPDSARAIPKENVRRVIRALEYYEKTGQPISVHNRTERAKSSPYDFRYFVLCMPRPLLYERINRRVDCMMEEGLTEEVKRLRDMGVTRGMTSMQGLGYREIYAYLEGETDYACAVDRIKRNTRHFAKRQMTWFKRERDVIFLDPDAAGDEQRILEIIGEHL